MTDVFTKAKRSAVMAAVKSQDTLSTEVALRKLLRREGITGWRCHLERLPGRPDFAFPSKRIAVFVDGCFWHGCPCCEKRVAPASNTEYWSAKIKANRQRDRKATQNLRDIGWRVIRIWEHELKKKPYKCITRIKQNMT